MSEHETVVTDGRVSVRRMRNDDTEFARMARWLNESHVRAWWDPDQSDATVETVRTTYGPFTDPDAEGVTAFIEDHGTPVGFVQFYPWSTEGEYCTKVGITVEPTAWAFDVFIGDPGTLGTGVATRALDLVCRHLIDERGASAVVIVTETTNVRAHHVYEKLGFVKVHEFLDIDTRGGERVRSYLMRKPAS